MIGSSLFYDYIDKDKYSSFARRFQHKESATTTQSDFRLSANDEEIRVNIDELLPSYEKSCYCELELDNPPRDNTPKNIDLYSTQVKENNKFSIVTGSDVGGIYSFSNDEYQLYNDPQTTIEPIKISETKYEIMAIGSEPYVSPVSLDELYLRLNIKYKVARSDWESYLLLAYQKYLAKDYRLAKLLSFISLEALIRYCRSEIKSIFNSISIRNIKLSDLIKLEEQDRSLNNEHMRLTEKLKQLLNIFCALSKKSEKEQEKVSKDILYKFRHLEKSRNQLAHGDSLSSLTNSEEDLEEFLTTLITMNKLIDLIIKS